MSLPGHLFTSIFRFVTKKRRFVDREPVWWLSRYVHRGGSSGEGGSFLARMNEREKRGGYRTKKKEEMVEKRGGGGGGGTRVTAEPVFERSGESGGYTFTDLHYPRLAPSSRASKADTHPSVPAQRTNCPVTHRPAYTSSP